MSDLISREAAKKLYCNICMDKNICYRNKENCEELNLFDKLPSAQPERKWIPCSEKYPDMDERVLVYTVSHDYHVWDCMSNRADNYFWEDEEGLYHGKYEVDLWMPLPKYEEEDND